MGEVEVTPIITAASIDALIADAQATADREPAGTSKAYFHGKLAALHMIRFMLREQESTPAPQEKPSGWGKFYQP